MAFNHGVASGTDVPIEHLDYNYIGNCKKASEVEALLRILRSNKEGYYPDLIKFTEQQLLKLNPQSKLLIKTEKAKKLDELSSSDSQEITAELEQWESQITDEETHLQTQPTNEEGRELTNGDTLPPIRKAGAIGRRQSDIKDAPASSTVRSKDAIKSSDYSGWEEYDVDKECTKLDSKKENNTAPSEGRTSVAIDTELSKNELNLSAMEKGKLGLREKEKGNEAFRSGDYEEALSYYTRSIKLNGLAPTYNNRAIALIKLKRYKDALEDCNKVLQMEPTNTKALLRRGMAHVSLEEEWSVVERDMETILKQEPNNKKAQEMLTQARKKIAKSGAKKKGRRVQIEEVDEESDNDPQHVPPITPPTMPQPVTPITTPTMPPAVLKLKDKGNDLFHKGQYGEAVLDYTRAIQHLDTADENHTSSLSILLNNRAACHLKNGNSGGCIEDCTRSLNLSPSNVKALVRRAQAYEQSEKYKLAYMDNQLALSLDRSMDAVYAANTRISKILVDSDGFNWRDHLPEHPDKHRIKPVITATLLNQQNCARGNQNEPKKEPNGTPSSLSSTPPITTSTPNNLQTKVTQATPTIPATVSSSSPTTPSPQELSNSERFEKAKAKGNDHVKKGQYLEALNCYSLCISACPQNVVGYTNRALCHIKLKSPSSAESDCNKALELDPHNVKALYRRAKSRKDLTKYSDAMKDLKLLLEVEPDNSVAQEEMAGVRKLWEKELRQLQATNQQKEKDKAPPPSRGNKSTTNKKKMKNKGSEKKKEKSQNDQQRELERLLEETKIKMNQLKKEVKDPLSFAEDFMKPSKTTYHTPKPGTPKPDTPKNTATPSQPSAAVPSASQSSTKRRRKVVIEEEEEPATTVSPPTTTVSPPPTTKLLSPYEFIQRWNGIARGAAGGGGGGDSGTSLGSEYGALLEEIPPYHLPSLITNKLEAPMLANILSAITTHFIPQKKCQLSADILVNLSKVPRFQTILMFLGKQEKTALVRILADMKDCGISSTIIDTLRKDYSVTDTMMT